MKRKTKKNNNSGGRKPANSFVSPKLDDYHPRNFPSFHPTVDGRITEASLHQIDRALGCLAIHESMRESVASNHRQLTIDMGALHDETSLELLVIRTANPQ